MLKTDYLTELNNRKAFDEALDDSISRAKARNTPLTRSVIDIDNFKNINDIHGHMEGDKILKNVAEHLKSFMRAKDIIARWGGDEFAIIFVCDLQTTQKVLTRIMDPVYENIFLKEYEITFSLGVSEYVLTDTTKSLLNRADKSLYKAKQSGKNHISNL